MADREYGILISVKDGATKALKGVGVSAKLAAKAFKVFAISSALLNQTLELGRKAFEVLRFAIFDTMAKAIEFRKAGDPMIQWFQDMKRESELVRARLGDALLPVMKTLSDVFMEVTGGISNWIEANRVLIATRLVEWIFTLGKWLTKVLNPAVKVLAHGFLALKVVWFALKSAFNSVWSFIAARIADVLDSVSMLAGLFSDKLAASISETKDSMQTLSEVFESSNDEAITGLVNTTLQFGKVGDAVDAATIKVDNFFDTFRERGLKAVRQSTAGINKTVEEQTKAIETVTEKQQEAAAVVGQTHDELQGVFTAGFTAMADAAEAGENMAVAAGKAVTVAAIDSATTVINAAAAKAIAEALAGTAGIPFVGLALGAAAAAVVSGLIKAQLNEFATGGMVTGGTPGRDSVPAVLMPGERVLTRSQARETAVAGQDGGGGTTINFNARVDALDIPTGPEKRRALLRLGRELEELVDDGMILRNVVRA
jgi:hypothetical protein